MSDIIPSTGRVLVKFGASWCVNCGPMTKVIDNAQLNIPVVDLDLDDYSEIAQDYLIRGVPTIVLLDNGKELRRQTGLITTEELKTFVER
jgi:thioredoxin 1